MEICHAIDNRGYFFRYFRLQFSFCLTRKSRCIVSKICNFSFVCLRNSFYKPDFSTQKFSPKNCSEIFLFYLLCFTKIFTHFLLFLYCVDSKYTPFHFLMITLLDCVLDLPPSDLESYNVETTGWKFKTERIFSVRVITVFVSTLLL